ncbi:hypothetical protein BH09PSE3_BH09PSE3_00470 [soil metagenome]
MTSTNVRQIETGEPDWVAPLRHPEDLRPAFDRQGFADRWPGDPVGDRMPVASHTRFERLDIYSDGTQIVSRTERSVYRAMRGGSSAMGAARIAGARVRALTPLRRAGLFAAWIAAVATAGFAMLPSHEQGSAKPPLTIALMPPTVVPPHRSTGAHPKHSGAAAEAPVQSLAPNPDAALAVADGSDTRAQDDVAASVDVALTRSFATSEPQSWQDGNQSGMVVVGPVDTSGRTPCRDVAVLTRVQGQPDQTINDRRCISPGGKVRIAG